MEFALCFDGEVLGVVVGEFNEGLWRRLPDRTEEVGDFLAVEVNCDDEDRQDDEDEGAGLEIEATEEASDARHDGSGL